MEPWGSTQPESFASVAFHHLFVLDGGLETRMLKGGGQGLCVVRGAYGAGEWSGPVEGLGAGRRIM